MEWVVSPGRYQVLGGMDLSGESRIIQSLNQAFARRLEAWVVGALARVPVKSSPAAAARMVLRQEASPRAARMAATARPLHANWQALLAGAVAGLIVAAGVLRDRKPIPLRVPAIRTRGLAPLLHVIFPQDIDRGEGLGGPGTAAMTGRFGAFRVPGPA